MPLIKEMPKSERPREKIIEAGAGRLSNVELLAILIGTGTKRESAMSLATKVLSMEKDGIRNLGDVTPHELSSIQGIGSAKACQIIAAVELGKRLSTSPRTDKINIGSPEDIASLFMENLRYLKKECFKILMLNTKNEIISIEDISVGNINSSIVDPRDVFRPAIKKGAAAVILIHNHPSGNPEPSEADISVTDKLRESGEILDIKVMDHLIIGDGVFTSFKRKKII